MSGFDKGWLALREPVDHVARDDELLGYLAAFLGACDAPLICDIGCGMGSTWRALEGRVPRQVSWLFFDNDPLLLEEARRRMTGKANAAFCQTDLNDLNTLPFANTSVFTASALFDLCSDAFCRDFVQRLVAHRGGLYAALNYDGVVSWSISHPLDAHMVSSFNKHQRTDKGFGQALGPDAAARLEGLFQGQNYRVGTRASPWRMDMTMADLQCAFLEGFRQPLLEMADLPQEEIEGWLAFRLRSIGDQGSLCEVGHVDLLALPL